jgi:hypothetical protein
MAVMMNIIFEVKHRNDPVRRRMEVLCLPRAGRKFVPETTNLNRKRRKEIL